MYKRLELHNHTTESDASITPEELIDLMYADRADAFAVTDHNTISGHPKIRCLLAEKKLPVDAIYGMEFTTYYGHILCLNLEEYVSWENINQHKPELLFAAAKQKNALVGIAHPFSYGAPFARGCRFDMTVSDFSNIDFIEVFNNPEPLHEVNEPGLLWWEQLVLQGHHLAATCGMDLHGAWDMAGQFATFIEGVEGCNIAQELSTAIHTQRTWVSKGPILTHRLDLNARTITFSITDTHKPGFSHDKTVPYLLALHTKKGTFCKEFMQNVPLCIAVDELEGTEIVIPKLYDNNMEIENLVVLAPVITLY